MVQLTQHPHPFPELQEASQNGYSHDFTTTPGGQLRCLSNPSRFYELEDVEIKLGNSSLQATLYLIKTKDGLYAGTLVDYWESSSHNF